MFNLKLIVIGSVAIVISAHHPISQEHVETIRLRTSKWTAHDVETNPLANKTIEELMGMCGTWIASHNGIERVQNFVGEHPDKFDPREEGHKWQKFIHEIRD
jgi:cathepsin B